jgi:crotonobetainyl-CoA:carnitine CoA-transferase CaiB-like acyl-CoA transferase
MPSVPGFDTIAQAQTGLMDMTGEPDGSPQRIGSPFVDYATGHNAFGAISAALYFREKTGIGQHIDVSLFGSALMMNNFVEQTSLGFSITRNGNLSKVVSPVGNYTCRNGSMVIMAQTDRLWRLICGCIGREDLVDDPGFNTSSKRVAQTNYITRMIVDWLETFEDIDTPIKILADVGIPCCKILNNEEAIDLASKADNGFVADMEIRDGNKRHLMRTRGLPFIFSETPGMIGKCAPSLGENSKEILEEIGYNDKIAAELVRKWNDWS